MPVDIAKTDTTAMGNLPRVVYFDFDSYVVKDEYRSTVEANAKVLSADLKKKVTIEGHTDDVGRDRSNTTLSLRRAEAVRTALIRRGVAANRLIAEGFGDTRPIADNTTEAGRARNRRIEIRAVSASPN